MSLKEHDYRTLNEMAIARDASVSWVIRQDVRYFIETANGPADQSVRPTARVSGKES